MEMTNSGSTRQNGVSLTSGKVPLEKTLGLRSARRGTTEMGRRWRLLMGRWAVADEAGDR